MSTTGKSGPEDGTGITTLSDSDIVSTRSRRRTFLYAVGASALGVTAVAAGAVMLASDFPKGESNTDVTRNANSKFVDSDPRNSKEVNTDQSELRDVKRSTDTN